MGRILRRRTWHVVWVVASSVIWAAVIIDTGDVGWPLGMWLLTTIVPLHESRRRNESAEARPIEAG